MMRSSSGRKEAAAALSIFSNLFLVILKLLVGTLTSSVSILSEALHSGMDLVASGIAYFSVRRADRPADRRHAYGHGKIENISGALEALLILLAAMLIIHEAVSRLVVKTPIRSLDLGIGVMALSSTLNLIISRYLFKTARKTDSMALEADAQHLLTDVYTSVGVLVGLVLIQATGIVLFDPLIALAVAALITVTAFRLTWKSLSALMDTKLPDEEEQIVADILQNHYSQAIEFHNLRTRKAGSHRHIDLHLVVQKDTHVEDAHQLCDHLEEEIRAALPRSTVNIHIEPDSIVDRRRGDQALVPEARGASTQDDESPSN